MTLTSILMFSPEFNLERKLCYTSVLSSHTAITTEITKLLAPQKKPSIAFEFWACSSDHLERPDWSRGIFALRSCFPNRGQQYGCVLSLRSITDQILKKCKTFFTSSTDDFGYYGFVRRVKEITETFQDLSCDQIRVRYLDDENCCVEEAVIRNGSGVSGMSLEQTGRESMFRPKCGIPLHHQRRERKNLKLRFSNPLLKMNSNLQPHPLVNKVSTIHHPLKIFVLKKSRFENKKHYAQHAHWHATCFILKYRCVIITITITLFT